ncbi:MAG: hypothetical protein QF449_05235 [Alphaproteobacteria bacterium]|jgi:hypothetical protein|nr:hypothetical protein [Alphaproteobacteria bacterium]MDP6590732.1 hypothetical protein [Alphaproteobacteria bacterium]MDP6817427.1 hypothetical protein [Alphaproteobacteria bacterium]|tara:strand:+ start:20 stop:391 length:372 start_codon:yes stop_codon:yes gene_type:complete
MADVTFDRPKPSRHVGRLMENLPGEMRDSFTEAQREALGEAMRTRTWRRQSVDIRLSLPLLSERFFMTVVAGRERRPGQRRKAERVFHPLGTVGNTLFMGAITTVICSVVLVIALVYSSILMP